MGLKLKPEVKRAFLERYRAARTVKHPRDVDANEVAVDVSACCRSVVAALEHMGEGHVVTASRISRRFFDKYTRNHPEASLFFFAFDSYADMHEIRTMMYNESRYKPASEERLSNLKPGEIAQNRRVYRYEARPYDHAEIETWTNHTEIDARRVFNGGASKQKLYRLMFDEMVMLAGEQLGGAHTRTFVFDGIGSHTDPRGVVTVTVEPDIKKPLVVKTAPRAAKHGEADQKLAHFFATKEDRGEGALWYTIDGDSIGQCVCLGLRPEIAFPNNFVVDTRLLPQGTSVGLALLADGGDYNESFMYAGIHSETLLSATETEIVTLEPGGRIVVDTPSLFRFLSTEPETPKRKRVVYTVEGEPPAKFYRTQAKAKEAADGVEVTKMLPNGHMVSRSIGDLVRSVVYWLHGGTANSSDFGLLDGLYAGLAGSFDDLQEEITPSCLGIQAGHVRPLEVATFVSDQDKL